MGELRRWVEWGRWIGWGGNRNRTRTTKQRLAASACRRLSLEALEDRRMLATLTVTSLDDTVAVDGELTLREAIQAAELDISVDGSVAGSGADAIEFHPSLSGAIHLSIVGDNSAGASAFSISTPITVHGNASGITITRSIVAGDMRFFHVAPSGALTLDSLMLTAGVARGENGVPGNPNGRDGRGGAVLNEGALEISSSTLYGNTSRGGAPAIGGTAGMGRGGAVFSDGAFVTIRNTTISGNAALNSDGTTANQAFGGGVFSRNGNLTINLSTIVDNASTSGRGIYVLGDGAERTSTLALDNSIVGNNGPLEEPTDIVVTHDNGGTSSSTGAHNLVRKEVAFAGAIVSHAAPQLGPLADNGGPTWTHAILIGSPALEAGSVTAIPGQEGMPLTDQRGPGFARTADGDGVLGPRIDIGAYELQSGAPVIALPGDYNADGIVDAADYTVWRDQLNQTVVAFTGADGDGSGTVDGADYNLWKAHFGETATALASGAAIASAPARDLVVLEQTDAPTSFDIALELMRLVEMRGAETHADSTRAQFDVRNSVSNQASPDLLNLLAVATVTERSPVDELGTFGERQEAQNDESLLGTDEQRAFSAVWDDWPRTQRPAA